MKWNDVIEKIMIENGGIASLKTLYNNASKYRRLPKGDWQKTIRGVLYRDVKNGRFKKVGLGVFAISSFDDESFAYKYATNEQPVSEYFENITDMHSTIEGMLIELGNFFEFNTFTSDLNKSFDEKLLKDLCSFNVCPEFTYPDVNKIVSKSDVIWFSKTNYAYPKIIFEVESSTDFTNSMHKMYQLIDFETKFFLVADEKKVSSFNNRLKREPFNSKKAKYFFRSFQEVSVLYFKSAEQNELKTKFLEKQ